MGVYTNKLIFDYVNGNDIYGVNVEDLENNSNFMMDVIKYTKDKRMYELCSDNVKNNYEFVKFMIDTFKNDVDFVASLTLNYLNNTNEEDITYKELLILASSLIGDSEYLLTLKLKRTIFNTLEFGSIESALNDVSYSKEPIELGMGFIFITDKYCNSDIIKSYFAKEFIEKIFYNEDITLEELIHKNFKSFGSIENHGINTFLINYIEMHDQCLATYISNHINLLENLRKEITKIGNNWDKYIENINIRRINILNQEVYNYIDENNIILSFSVQQLIMYVIRKYKLEDIFTKYDEVQQYIDFERTDISDNNIDEGKMDIMELKCLKYICDLVDELFKADIIEQKTIKDNNKKYNGHSKILKFKK